jgi:hypothetical protein
MKKPLLAAVAIALVVLALFGLVLVAWALILGPRTIGAWWYVRKLAREEPRVHLVPQPLGTLPEPTSKGSRIECFGYVLNVPWEGIQQRNVYPLVIRTIFQSGKSLACLDERGQGPATIMTEKGTWSKDDIGGVFGHKTVASDYAFYQEVLNLTPDRLSIFTPGKKAVGVSVLLILKTSILVPAHATAVYSFSTEDVRGFQFGIPGKDRSVRVVIFDGEDQTVSFLIFRVAGGEHEITQSEVSRIIASIRVHTTDAAAKPDL